MSQDAMNRDPHDVNKGLNVKQFLAAVFVAFVFIMVGALIMVRASKNKIVPHATTPKTTSAESPQ